jgi:dolichol-phosphate mannosyltransferase
VNPDVSRDFVYVDDVSEAFVDAAVNLREEDYGESFNIGTGKKTTIRDVAALAASALGLAGEPNFSMPNRRWDVTDWFANAEKSHERLGWSPRTEFSEGFTRMVEWYRSLPDKEAYHRSSKLFGLDTKHSVSAVVSCRNHTQAVPIAYQRLRDVLHALNVDYEIVFVDDASDDGTDEAIRKVSADDRRVIGVSHSRPFGLAACFRSGMEVASKNGVVLIDGSLRDPPELIKDFVAKWREGYDVVYGRRSGDDRPLLTRTAYAGFYRLFQRFSSLTIPKDAGDFALMDRMVVRAMLQFPERDLFLAGVRAYAGFKQVGVDYRREKPVASGRKEHGMFRKLGRGTRGILSFTNVPLNLLTWFGLVLTFASIVLGIIQVVIRIVAPNRSASGVTTVLLGILFFGAINLLAIALIGEYIGKIFQEVKRRPHYIRRTYVREGVTRTAAVDEPGGIEK